MVNVSRLLCSAKSGIQRHSPEILTGMGIGGMVTTVVFAVRATPKALYLIKREKRKEKVNDLTPWETIKVAWKPYIPAAVTGGASIACIIGASKVNAKRNAALFTAYTLSENAMREYKDKVVETIGKKKEGRIRDDVAKDRIDNDPIENNEIYVTGFGEQLCYDSVSGRYFKSDIDKIKDAISKLNQELVIENYISLNEFYSEIGIQPISIGDELGWNISEGWITPEFSSQLAGDKIPCLVIAYSVTPRYDYRTLY